MANGMSSGDSKVEGPRVGNLGAQPAPAGAQGQQPHFIRMYRDSFSRELCDEVIRRFEADERKHASTTATRDKPRLRSGTMLKLPFFPQPSNFQKTSLPDTINGMRNTAIDNNPAQPIHFGYRTMVSVVSME